MKLLTVTLSFLLLTVICIAQQSSDNLYNVEANAFEQIKNAQSAAKESKKHIFLQIGGNWCKWCRLFNKWSKETATVDSLINADYVVVHLNYSKENKNDEALKSLGYPQRFGFPVFVILDSEGNRLHTQNTAHLESGDGYDEEKVIEFLKHWNTAAISAETYSKE